MAAKLHFLRKRRRAVPRTGRPCGGFPAEHLVKSKCCPQPPLCRGWGTAERRWRGCYRKKLAKIANRYPTTLQSRIRMPAPTPQAGTLLSASQTFPLSGELPPRGEAFVSTIAFPFGTQINSSSIYNSIRYLKAGAGQKTLRLRKKYLPTAQKRCGIF